MQAQHLGIAERLPTAQQLQHGPRHQHGREHGEHDPDTERESEAFDTARGRPEQDDGGDDGGHVAVEDRAERLPEAGAGSRPDGLPCRHLVPHAGEDQHVRVDSHTQGEDHARNARQGHRHPYQVQDPYEQDPVNDESDTGYHAEQAIVGDHEDHDRDEADDAGEEGLVQGGLTEDGADAALAHRFEVDWQSTCVQHQHEVVDLGLGEAAGDLGIAVGDLIFDRGSGLHFPVEHDGEALGLLGDRIGVRHLLGDLVERCGAVRLEVHLDLGLVGARLESGRGALEHAPGHGRRGGDHIPLVFAGRVVRGGRPVDDLSAFGQLVDGCDLGGLEGIGRAVVGGAEVLDVEELKDGRLADDRERLVRVLDARKLDADLVRALALDLGFSRTELVHAVGDDLDRLIHLG